MTDTKVGITILVLVLVGIVSAAYYGNWWQPQQIIDDGWTLRWEQDGFNCYSYDVWLRESDRDTWAPAKSSHLASRVGWTGKKGGYREVSEGVCQAHVAEAYSDYQFMVVSPVTPGVTRNPEQDVLTARRN